MIMQSVETYKLLKNLIHNELKITKSDIKAWCQEAVKQETKSEVHRYIQKNNFEAIVNKAVKECVAEIVAGNSFTGTNLKKVVAEKLANQVASSITIGIKETKNGRS